MTSVTLPTIERTEIDGVPVIWSPAPGPLTAVLMFRVGRIDEEPSRSGLTHIVEHLAMAPLGDPRYEHNAFVDGGRTAFYATGRPEEIVAFLGSVCAALSDLRVSRLVIERDVLLREQDQRSDSVVDAHRNFRFGIVGHGLVAQPEFGLPSITEDEVRAWAARGFVAGNAMAWLSGPPPQGLRLELPPGERLAPPPPRPIADIRWPAHLDGVGSGVSLGFLVPRRRGAGSMLSILRQRMRQRLRLESGLVYDVMSDYEALDAELALSLVGGDCAPESTQAVVDVAVAELEALARGEATDRELADELADLERGLEDETAVTGLLDAIVRDALIGYVRTPESIHEDERETTAAHVAERATEARASALLLADVERAPAGFSPYPKGSTAQPIAGREVKPFLSVLGFGPKLRLTIGPDGVSLRGKDGTITVRYEDCALLERASEDDLVMWSRDGTRLYVPGPFWRGGEEILAEIQSKVPPSAVTTHKFSADLID